MNTKAPNDSIQDAISILEDALAITFPDDSELMLEQRVRKLVRMALDEWYDKD